jgi:purine-binding chemotaxis protein CheW
MTALTACETVAVQDAADAAPREVLAFRLGDGEYGVDILRVHEIRSYEKPTRIAHAPDFVKGVINLRGAIVPIVDLRLRLGLAQAAYDAFTVVVVLELGRRIVGMVVDAVSDVVALAPQELREVPDLGSGELAAHLLAIGTAGERLLGVLDVERLLAAGTFGATPPLLQ